MDNAINEQVSLVGTRSCFFAPYSTCSSTPRPGRGRQLAVFNWSVDTRDWEARGSADPYSVNQIISLAQAGWSQSNPVILFHNQPGGNPATVAALPSIIAYYRDLGYTFVDLAGGVPPRRTAPSDISPVAVAAARTSAGTALAFVRGTDGALWVTTGTTAGFGPYQRIPAGTLSGPAAVSTDGRRVDVFVVGTDRALWHTGTVVDAQGKPTTWWGWENLGGVLTAAPAVASGASGRFLVTGRASSALSSAWDGTAWRGSDTPSAAGPSRRPRWTWSMPGPTARWSWAPMVPCGSGRRRRSAYRWAHGRRRACPPASRRERAPRPAGRGPSARSPTAAGQACGRSGATAPCATSAAP